MNWLPEGKTAAVCFSIDDVHPSTSRDAYEAGGDLGNGALCALEWLLGRHPQLRATLFVTPDWRPVQLVRSRFAARLPLIAKHVYHVELQPKSHFRLDRHAEFVRYLNGLERVEMAPHGLHHVHRGHRLAVEFQEQGHRRCAAALRQAIEIFEAAGLEYVSGFAPPGWNLPLPLLAALEDMSFAFVSSARDIHTPIRPGAINAMSGLREVSILAPERIGTREIVHIPINFQATSVPNRAHEIIACGGLLSIKAHIFKHGGGYTMADGLDNQYAAYLDDLLSDLERRYGDSLWWTSMSQAAARCERRTDASSSLRAA